MKLVPSLFALPILCMAVGAQAADTPQQLPDRPAAVLANQEGRWSSVVGAIGDAPIVNDNGNRSTLKGKMRIVVTPGGHYGGGFVTISDVYSKDIQRTNDPTLEADMADSMPEDMDATTQTLKANLTPDTDIPGAYAVFISSPPEQESKAVPSLAVLLREIGDLKAGVQAPISVVLPKRESGWNLLVFAGGRQVRSTDMGRLLPAYFDKLESDSLGKTIADRNAKGADAPIAIFREMPLGLPEAIVAKYKGKTIKVGITVGSDGRVTQAAPVGLDDADLSDAISKGFSHWLFVPPVKNGTSSPGNAILPVKL
jgi:hypothetical protein